MKPNVLAIIDTGIIGGPGKGLFMLIKHAPQELVTITPCCIKYRRKVATGFIEEAARLNLDLKLIEEDFRFDPRIFPRSLRLLKDGGYNLIQSHNYKSHLLAFVLSKLTKIPWVAWTHGWTGEDWKVKLYHSIDLGVLRYADAVIAVSPQLLDKLSAIRGREKLTAIIQNAIEPVEHSPDDAVRKEVRKQFNIGDSCFVAGCFGRLSREKGQSVLLNALAAMPHRDNLRLIFCGDGPDRKVLESLSRELNLMENVIFAGHQNDLRKYFRSIDLLILPSLSEGLPNVVLEAMAHGVPVLSTNVGAVGEIIRPELGNGWLVEKNDPLALGTMLSHLMNGKMHLESAGRAAKEALFPRFSPGLRAKKVIAIYEEVLKRRSVIR